MTGSGTPDVTAHLDALCREGALMSSAAAAADPGAPVPTCPDWQARDLVHHTGGVHRWATGVVADARTEPWAVPLDEVVGTWPGDDELADWLGAGCDTLEATLRGAPADLECWTFLPAPSPLAMWARRQAHETAIHRVDMERAAGTMVTPFEAAFAADGVDELLTCFVPRRRTGLRAEEPHTLAVACTDADSWWLLRIGEEGVTTSAGGPGPAPAAGCAVQAAACELYLALWNRTGADRLTVNGDPGVLDAFLDTVRIRWS